MRTNSTARTGFSLIELVVVTAIIALVLGLLLSAVQNIRESGNRLECNNNVKELVLACQAAHTLHRRLPPGLGYYPHPTSGAWGTGLYHVLPFLEQKNLYGKGNKGVYNFGAWNEDVYKAPVKTFVCPSDGTANGGVAQDFNGNEWGACSYAGNVQVFSRTEPSGHLQNPQGRTTINSIRDGTHVTILFGEHYARCTNALWPEGGNFWAYWETEYAWPLHPAFAISWTPGSIGPRSKFQYRPSPTDCDPTLASTAHIGGMTVGMCDGSVRTLHRSISGEVWWQLCTPRNGDPTSHDF